MDTIEQLIRTFPSDYPNSVIADDQLIKEEEWEREYWAWQESEDLATEAAQRSADARSEFFYFSPQDEGLLYV